MLADAVKRMVENSARFYGGFSTVSERKRWLWERFEHLRPDYGIKATMDEKQRLLITAEGATLYDSNEDRLNNEGFTALVTSIYERIEASMAEKANREAQRCTTRNQMNT